MQPTLLILAAGLGSRYGSLKQLDQLGPGGETIMDYSVYDALRAGFGKVVFVIRRDIEHEFQEFVRKFQDRIEIAYVHQELDQLPEGVQPPEGRVKPWGTGHAVWVAAPAVHTPFAMINADDFYGREAFQTLGDYLRSIAPDSTDFSMVGYQLENTLSEFGYVSRGECETDSQGLLTRVTERTKIRRAESGDIVFLDGETERVLPASTVVSMNMWGFTPAVFELCRRYFVEFIRENGHDLKAELYIPSVVGRAIEEGIAQVRVLSSDAVWFGVTYKEDKALAADRIRARIAAGEYPEHLWS
ncbi:MAG: sugar phosphate nucleotidyltransferase [Bacteroidia bacterium]|nr:sugar phosphate nucleotidyltransferase [Bacteroidia bacterium]